MTIRVGNCSGYYGDRLSAMREMLEGGDLDYLTGDYLAELTMLILGRDQLKDSSLGYARTFVRQLGDCMSLAKERGVKIVANAGGVNPEGLADALRKEAAEQGIDVRIAHIEGDDLRHRAEEFGFGPVLTANAYLGAFGIAAALDAGADIVVTGRVTDASVVVGPAIHAYGWTPADLDELAGAVIAGHVIECGTQATGGNFAGFATIDTSRPLGFPIAEIDADGSSVITKHAAHGGAVTVDTVTAQLVYEIQGLAYGNPDVVTDLTSIRLAADGPDRVRISDVKGTPPPTTTKVCLNSLGGFRNTLDFQLTGLDIEAKAAWVQAQIEAALAADAPDELVWQLDRTDVVDPPTQAQATAILRCHARSTRPEPVGRAFSDAAVQIGLASYPGFYMFPPSKGGPYGVYRADYVPQSEVPHIVVFPDGSRREIAPPTVTAPFPPQDLRANDPFSTPERAPLRAKLGETRGVPLGELVYARSGDKGGNANVGLWIPVDHPRRDEAYAWLVGQLTPERVRELLPEAAELDVEIYHLPGIAAVNIIIVGLLGEGVASSTRLDPQAKAVGEWLRARIVDIPESLLSQKEPTA